jgi:hydroxymethylpyrimidine pyrophosphatase-like HAD family hydrolase
LLFKHILGKLAKNFEALGLKTRHKYISQNGKYIYHIAIIDYLQAFDLEKKAENFIKKYIYNREEYKISAVNP